MLIPRNIRDNDGDKQVVLSLEECIAKTIKGKDGHVYPGQSVTQHCFLTGLVAREIINRYPESLRSSLFPIGSELIAALHDIGKVWHIFQEKIHLALRTKEYPEGRKLGLGNPALEKRTGGHAEVSQAAITGKGKYLPEIVGRHHGYSQTGLGLPGDEIYGGEGWQKLRMMICRHIKDELNVCFPEVNTAVTCDLLTGLTSVSDWISSGYFEHLKQAAIHLSPETQKEVFRAVTSAGFIRPVIRKGLAFDEIFGFRQNQIQQKFSEIANRHGVYIIEAPMGQGKTEAALYAAYKLLESEQAGGIYFALPTQLTSDKMHERMGSFLNSILEPDSANRSPLLLHGSAWLKNTEIGEEGTPGNSWFNSTKRGILAPFAVGTVDQALMAAMNVKHGFVRTFGLAGKVVILDEIHSYDMYTGTLIDELIKVLEQIKCTVIILSATLTTQRRLEILRTESPLLESAYPLISEKPNNGKIAEYAQDPGESSQVIVRCGYDESEAIGDAVERAYQGQQVLWIENTIGEAQLIYKKMGARASGTSIEYGLLHSRFIKNDRGRIEEKWVSLYGKNSGKKRTERGRILIGTQVLEQSLDIDADFIVTRICPSDMLFQRIGRLWRHNQNNTIRPPSARREILILTPLPQRAFAKRSAFGKTGNVYEPYTLCRTLEVWEGLEEVSIPQSIPEILEKTYSNREETGLLADYKSDLEHGRRRLAALAYVGVARSGKTLPEKKASTRHSDYGSIDVLLLRSRFVTDGENVKLVMLDGNELKLDIRGQGVDKKMNRVIAAELQKNTVCVPEWLAPDIPLQQMKWLQNYAYIADAEGETVLRAVIVKPDGTITGLGHENPFTNYRVSYSADMGYNAVKIENQEFD